MNVFNHTPPLNPAEMKASFLKLNLYLSELDESEKKAIHLDWRYRLIQFSEDLATTPKRLDWFFHQLMQEHDLTRLISLVHEFNSLQLRDLSESQDQEVSLDIFQMEIKEEGLFLTKLTHTRPHTDLSQLKRPIQDSLTINTL